MADLGIFECLYTSYDDTLELNETSSIERRDAEIAQKEQEIKNQEVVVGNAKNARVAASRNRDDGNESNGGSEEDYERKRKAYEAAKNKERKIKAELKTLKTEKKLANLKLSESDGIIHDDILIEAVNYITNRLIANKNRNELKANKDKEKVDAKRNAYIDRINDKMELSAEPEVDMNGNEIKVDKDAENREKARLEAEKKKIEDKAEREKEKIEARKEQSNAKIDAKINFVNSMKD